MLIPLKRAGEYGCHVTRALPPDQRSPCAGRKCAAWVVRWAAGARVPISTGVHGYCVALEEMGVCGLLPRSLGNPDDEATDCEARQRREELLRAGVLKFVPTPPPPMPGQRTVLHPSDNVI